MPKQLLKIISDYTYVKLSNVMGVTENSSDTAYIMKILVAGRVLSLWPVN